MSKAFMAIGVVILGIVAFAMVNVIQDYSTGNDLDYYLLKETTKGAMEDAIDLSFYRMHGVLRMDKEKFVDSFARRFANQIQKTKDYTIRFYDINETPPKVSVRVNTSTASTFHNESLGIENTLDAIIESVYTDDMIIKAICKDDDNKYNICDYKTIEDGSDYYHIIN